MKLVPALVAFGLAAAHSLSCAETCEVAAGQTLVNSDSWRICDGGFVGGLLHNPPSQILDTRNVLVGYPAGGPNSGTVLTDGAFLSRDPGLVSFGTVTISGPRGDGAQGSFVQYNSGTMYSFGQFSNFGLFTNHGRATFGGGSDGRSVLNNAGTLVNLGTLELATGSEFVIPIAGGTITWIPGDSAYLINSGEINNLPGASLLLQNDDAGRLDFTGGRLINEGYLLMRRTGLQMGEANAGTLELRAKGTADIDFLSVNSGYLQSNAGLLIARQLQVRGALQNDGTMVLGGTASVDDDARNGDRGLINNGSLHIGGRVGAESVSATLYLHFQGRLENQGRLTIEAGSALINRSVLLSAGELINQGKITNQAGSFEIAAGGRFTLDGSMLNSAGGTVTFDAGSVTSGVGLYRQIDGITLLNGRVDLPTVEIAGGMLCGSGVLNGKLVVSGGAVCPGNSPGTLHIGGDAVFQGGTLRLEIAGTSVGLYDVLQVDGALSFAPGVVLDVAFVGGYLPQAGDSWSMLRAAGAPTGLTGLELRLSGLPEGYALAVNGSGQFGLQAAAVPEPGSWLMMLGGLGALGSLCGLGRLARWRKAAGLVTVAVAGCCTLPANAA